MAPDVRALLLYSDMLQTQCLGSRTQRGSAVARPGVVPVSHASVLVYITRPGAHGRGAHTQVSLHNRHRVAAKCKAQETVGSPQQRLRPEPRHVRPEGGRAGVAPANGARRLAPRGRQRGVGPAGPGPPPRGLLRAAEIPRAGGDGGEAGRGAAKGGQAREGGLAEGPGLGVGVRVAVIPGRRRGFGGPGVGVRRRGVA